jgi:hypothetical protein
MLNFRNHSRSALIGIVLGVLPLFGAGCAGHMYMSTLRDYPNCVTQAQISRAKVDACMDSSDKASFNDCLLSQKVPQSKIDVLNACVDSHRRSSIGNFF